ncbi:helix-turn-helix domain-containing protein [Burkholderia sp. S171]|uniref:helix-turn-helix domain-containing protein n=1 Tax=Burkholderia sp. S171 TaxID=1641860 RepID=UPI00131D0A59|nr:helix-turn-helix domain-containing protein [Burkholderia sp. S171]
MLNSDFPVFASSRFSGDTGSPDFDLVRLENQPDIPREFLHRHDYYHLLWMSEVAGTHRVDFEIFEARSNSVFFISPGQLHSWTSSVKPQGFIINFSVEFFVKMFPRADEIAKFPFFHMTSNAPVLYLDQTQHDTLLSLVFEMEQEMLRQDEARLDIVRSYLLILLTRLRRCYPERSTDRASSQNYTLVRRFNLLIEQQYLHYGHLRNYAQELHVTERTLNDAVKRTLGKTASDLIYERLVLEAKRLLSNTDMAISEIAYQLHFDDHAYFSRFFKKRTQFTPVEFKKRYGQPR